MVTVYALQVPMPQLFLLVHDLLLVALRSVIATKVDPLDTLLAFLAAFILSIVHYELLLDCLFDLFQFPVFSCISFELVQISESYRLLNNIPNIDRIIDHLLRELHVLDEELEEFDLVCGGIEV